MARKLAYGEVILAMLESVMGALEASLLSADYVCS
jgi:hypothetical protein